MEDLIERVKAGDEHAFRQLVGPYQGELQLHCYRILGSAQDAEDAVQETLLAAWRGLAQFEGRASIRTWLYRVATNCCLKALRSASRRPPVNWPPPGVDVPKPSRVGEVIWLQPYPDMLLEVITAPRACAAPSPPPPAPPRPPAPASSRPGPTASPRSACTPRIRRPGSSTRPGCLSSPSPATASAP